MEIVRRNTDYALRAILNLAIRYSNESVSSRDLAQKGQIPYQITCKLMQKLHDAKLVESFMGRKGGFRLSKDPSNISLLEVVKAIQGPVRLNRCLSGYGLALRRDELGKGICPQQKKCKVRMRLIELEQFINSYLDSITLDEIVKSKGQRIKGKRDKWRKK